MKNKALYIVLSFFIISCKENKKEVRIDRHFFTIIQINKDSLSMKINQKKYYSSFTVNNLKSELDSSLHYYYQLNPNISNQILVKYKEDINSEYLKEIKSILQEFHKNNSNKNKITQKVLNKEYYDTNVEEREIISKYYPKIFYEIR